MEALLSHAFDNLSSYDNAKIKKGLRQIEGLLAQICLAPLPHSTTPSPSKPSKAGAVLEKRRGQPSNTSARPESSCSSSSSSQTTTTTSSLPRKQLIELPLDLAFLEFFKLQEGFEWNVALRLVNCLDRLMGKSNDGANDLLILACLDLIQGVLLLHPPSRTLFSRELYMNHLLDLLEPCNCPAIQSATLHTLVVCLLSTPANTRTFEALDGLLTITSIFKSRSTSRDVKLKLVEFLYFYLMPETATSSTIQENVPPTSSSNSGKAELLHGSSESVVAGRKEGRSRRRNRGVSNTRTQEEKQKLLGKHLKSVDELVSDLRERQVFDGVVC